MHTEIQLTRGEIESAIDYAISNPKFSSSRNVLLKGLKAIATAAQSEAIPPYAASNLEELRTKVMVVLKKIAIKQIIQPHRKNQHPATSLVLRNKLKPTSDGKEAAIDNKATNAPCSFFINFWNLPYVKSQDRAFT